MDMTREDKLKLVVTAIDNMVSTRIDAGRHLGRDAVTMVQASVEQARQELLRALVQADTNDDVNELEHLREINRDLVARIGRALMILRDDPTATSASRKARAILALALEDAKRIRHAIATKPWEVSDDHRQARES
jgi:hypothetical protein